MCGEIFRWMRILFMEEYRMLDSTFTLLTSGCFCWNVCFHFQIEQKILFGLIPLKLCDKVIKLAEIDMTLSVQSMLNSISVCTILNISLYLLSTLRGLSLLVEKA